MNSNLQIRIRLSKGVASRFASLPPRSRSRAVSFLLASVQEGLDLAELLQARRELISLGVLINQSLRLSWGQSTDGVALHALMKILQRILT